MENGHTSLPAVERSGRILGAAACIVIAVVLAYANTFRVPLLLDDYAALEENPSIRDLSDWSAVLSPPPTSPTAGRPLLNLSFALNHAAGGTDVRGYHVVNLAIHAAAALVLFGLVRRTLGRQGIPPALAYARFAVATAAATLWAMHPLLTGAVTYISQRAESLMGLFYFLTLYGFVRDADAREPRWWGGVSILACFAGMATKEVMVTAPLLVLLYDRVFVSGSFAAAFRSRRPFYAGLAASWVLLALVMANARLEARNIGFEQGVSPWAYAATEARVIFDYLRLALWPSPLVFDYGIELLAQPLRKVPFVVALAALGWGVVKAWRVRPAAGFALLAVFVVLAPTSSFVPVAMQPMAESRMYVPLAPLVTLLVAWLFTLVGSRRAIAATVAIVAAAMVLAHTRNDDYRSAVALWEDTVAKKPGSSRAHHSLANELARNPARGQATRARYEAALRINPGGAEIHYDFATWLEKQPGGHDEARQHYETALRSNPRHAKAHNNLASLLAREPEDRPAAIRHLEQALRIDPAYAEAHYNLGSVLMSDPQRAEEALDHLQTSLRLRPGYAEAHNNLANLLGGMPGREADALRHYGEAVRLKRDFAEAHNNLGSLLTRLADRRGEATAHFREAIRIRPDFAEAHYNLARELAAQPDGASEAITHFRAALRARPAMAIAHNGLADVLFKTGALDDAIRELEAAVRIDPSYETARHNLDALRRLKKTR